MDATKKRSKASDNGNGSAVSIEINADGLTWDDMRLFFGLGDNPSGERMLELADLFDRVVVGGAKAVPISRTQEVIEAIGEAMRGFGNPKA